MKRTVAAKVKQASQHPHLPQVLSSLQAQGYAAPALSAGEPGAFRPHVDPARCEGKDDCVHVCPYDVFDVSRIAPHVYAQLPVLAKFKLRVHGMRTATTPRADACHACGLCVVACPERAIDLRAFVPPVAR